MQWIAILASFGWGFLQVILLFIATQCIFLMIDFRSPIEHKIHQKFLAVFIPYLFYSLFIIPFISFGLFIYGAINITAWGELKPAMWSFFIWCITLIMFCFLLNVKRKYRN